jgi:hypothetical protein
MNPNQANGYNYYMPGAQSSNNNNNNNNPYNHFFNPHNQTPQHYQNQNFQPPYGPGANQRLLGPGHRDIDSNQMPGYGSIMAKNAPIPTPFDMTANPNVVKRSKKEFFEGSLISKEPANAKSSSSIMQSLTPKATTAQNVSSQQAKQSSNIDSKQVPKNEKIRHLFSQIRQIINTN